MPRVVGWMGVWIGIGLGFGCTAAAEIGIQVLVSACDYAIECKWRTLRSGGLAGGMWNEASSTRVCVCVCVFARLDCSASLIQFHFDFGISDLPMPMPMAAQIANQIVGQIFNRVNMFMPNQAISFKHTPHDEALVPPPLCVCVLECVPRPIQIAI